MEEILNQFFSEVSRENYMDSIWSDIEDAKDEIVENAMYVILNLCRVLAYKRDNLILSKQEGGEWGMNQVVNPEYKSMILDALKEYQTGVTMSLNKPVALDFARYMLEQIESE